MSRARIAIGCAAAGLAAAALLLGGAFSGPGARPAPAGAPRQTPAAASGENAVLGELIAGLSTGDTEGFTRRLERRIAKNPYDADGLTMLGLAYQQRARETGDPAFFTLSEKALRRAVGLQQRQPLAITGLASLSVSRHRFNDALALARRALERNADDAGALAALGDALLNLGRYGEAFRAFDRMVELAPSIGSYARISYARELLGRPKAALDALEFSFDLGRSVPEHVAYTWVQIGNLDFNTGRLDAAERAYRRALGRIPGYVHAEAGLARVEAARGDYGPAIARLRDAVDRLPLPQYAILLGDVLTAAGRTAEAADAYALVDAIERLLEANGVRTELQTALFALDHDRDVAAALERAEEAYRAAPGINAEDVLAWALYRNGRCSEALAHSEHALRLGTRDALMFFHRGMIERCAGNESASRAFLRRALDLNPSFSFLYAPVARRLLGEPVA